MVVRSYKLLERDIWQIAQGSQAEYKILKSNGDPITLRREGTSPTSLLNLDDVAHCMDWAGRRSKPLLRQLLQENDNRYSSWWEVYTESWQTGKIDNTEPQGMDPDKDDEIRSPSLQTKASGQIGDCRNCLVFLGIFFLQIWCSKAKVGGTFDVVEIHIWLTLICQTAACTMKTIRDLNCHCCCDVEMLITAGSSLNQLVSTFCCKL